MGLVIGTAGWSVDRALPQFAGAGSGLERYAGVFTGVEINSSFYRRHLPATWQRWHDTVPEDFRFAVKMPKRISHELRLRDAKEELARFVGDIAPLGPKVGPLLLQLPPSLAFEADVGERFFDTVRQLWVGAVVIEPRHPSWAADEVSAMLESHRVSRVWADPQEPALRDAAAGATYWRLHGSPKVYYSAYEADWLGKIAVQMAGKADAWCIFDNTASGAALRDALALLALTSGRAGDQPAG